MSTVSNGKRAKLNMLKKWSKMFVSWCNIYDNAIPNISSIFGHDEPQATSFHHVNKYKSASKVGLYSLLVRNDFLSL